MKRDEIRAIFPDITDEQLKAIMDINGADINAANNKTKDAQAKLDEANSKLAEVLADNEAKAKANMSIEERLKAMEEERLSEKKALAVEKNTLSARQIFHTAGISESDYENLLNIVVSDNAETTATNANAVAALVTSTQKAAEEKAKKDLLGSTPHPEGGSKGAKVVTKEEFDAMDYNARLKVYNESPELFKELND